MASDCYYRTNSLINVDYIKIDTDTSNNFEESLKEVDYMQFTTVLQKNFKRENINDGEDTGDTDINKTDKFYFTPNLVQAKYFSPEPLDEGVTYNIYRKTPFQKYYDYIGTLEKGAESLLDYNVVNNQYYHYMAWLEFVATKDETELSNAESETEYYCYEDRDENYNLRNLKTSFDRWSICDIEESNEEGVYNKIGNTWILGLNMQNPEIAHNLSISAYDTLGRYGKISMGQKKYDSSNFTGLLGDMEEYTLYNIGSHDTQITGEPSNEFYMADGEPIKNNNYLLFNMNNKQIYRYTEKINLQSPYARETEKLESWKEFCANGNLKLLRDIKGNAWIVQIIDSPKSTIELSGNISQTTISFSWQEIEDISSYSIVGVLD